MSLKISQFFRIIFLISLLIPFTARAYFEESVKTEKNLSMNEIKLSDYPDFAQKWHLVTVRFREDTREMRFTYANDLAWKALQSFKPVFPDGAVFGKIGMKTEVDPAFPSSKVPAMAKRFQFMVKNQKKYKDTDGWGYALFDSEGYIFNENPKVATQACAACHRIVPERGYVFSRPVELGVGWIKEAQGAPAQSSDAIQFKEVKTASLPKKLREIMGEKNQLARSLEGALKKNSFSGTLDEVLPLLTQQTKSSGQPSFFMIDENNFSITSPTDKTCSELKKSFASVVFYNGKKVLESENCE